MTRVGAGTRLLWDLVHRDAARIVGGTAGEEISGSEAAEICTGVAEHQKHQTDTGNVVHKDLVAAVVDNLQMPSFLFSVAQPASSTTQLSINAQ